VFSAVAGIVGIFYAEEGFEARDWGPGTGDYWERGLGN